MIKHLQIVFGRIIKAMQRKPVKRPGSRGGKGYYDKHGVWQYGVPTPARAAQPGEQLKLFRRIKGETPPAPKKRTVDNSIEGREKRGEFVWEGEKHLSYRRVVPTTFHMSDKQWRKYARGFPSMRPPDGSEEEDDDEEYEEEEDDESPLSWGVSGKQVIRHKDGSEWLFKWPGDDYPIAQNSHGEELCSRLIQAIRPEAAIPVHRIKIGKYADESGKPYHMIEGTIQPLIEVYRYMDTDSDNGPGWSFDPSDASEDSMLNFILPVMADYLVGNTDLHGKQTIQDKDGDFVPIDHGFTHYRDDSYGASLDGFIGELLWRPVGRAFGWIFSVINRTPIANDEDDDKPIFGDRYDWTEEDEDEPDEDTEDEDAEIEDDDEEDDEEDYKRPRGYDPYGQRERERCIGYLREMIGAAMKLHHYDDKDYERRTRKAVAEMEETAREYGDSYYDEKKHLRWALQRKRTIYDDVCRFIRDHIEDWATYGPMVFPPPIIPKGEAQDA